METLFESGMLFEEFLKVSSEMPSRVAVRCDDIELTYGELRRKAFCVAARLPEKREEREIILVDGEKSVEMIVAIVGILLAGYSYCVLNPSASLKKQILLAKPRGVFWGGDGERIKKVFRDVQYSPEFFLSSSGIEILGDFEESIVLDFSSESIAYILFTSGSTGVPKGVCVSHRASSASVKMFLDAIQLNEQDVVGNLVELCFDLSVFDIFSALSVGATLRLIQHDLGSEIYIGETLKRCGVTSLFVAPAVVKRDFSSKEFWGSVKLRRLCFSGEKLTCDFLKKLLAEVPDGVEVWNFYGATEFPYALARKFGGHDWGFPNMFDRKGDVVEICFDDEDASVGESSGELRVSGPAILSYYLHDVDKKFSSEDGFATGDLISRRFGEDDFSLTLVGRKDRQVKLNGYRIDLDYIEEIIEQHVFVKGAIVLLTDSMNVLNVFLQVRDGFDLTDMKRYLAEEFGQFVFFNIYSIDAIPMTASGKKNRKVFKDGAFYAEDVR